MRYLPESESCLTCGEWHIPFITLCSCDKPMDDIGVRAERLERVIERLKKERLGVKIPTKELSLQ